MAFTRSTMARSTSHANSDAPVIWAYATSDTQATVNTAGYFNDMVNELEVGDLIYGVCNGAAVLFHVLSNDGTDVDVADGTVLAATDTD